MGHEKLKGFAIALFFGLVVAQTQEQIDLKANKLQDDKHNRIMENHDASSTTSSTSRRLLSNDDEEEKKGRWFEHEKDNSYWYKEAHEALKKKLNSKINTGVAKNIIFFLGDGMSIATLTAARIYLGQLDDKPGEEGALYWENFPYTGLCKTWCIDKQVPESACTGTAYLGGVKTKSNTIGLNGNVEEDNCDTQIKENNVDSIAKWAQDNGKGTGIVTTMTVTHASPSGAYAHSANRKWESDTNVLNAGYDPKKCHDIATQLVKDDPGKNFKVILGGGRQNFLPKRMIDETGDQGIRSDDVNLIDEWIRDKHQRSSRYSYSWNRTSLNEIRRNPENYDYLLGLFASSHLQYHLESSETQPTLEEMTEAAIKVLRKEKKGYFLFVEGGKIDHAHHDNYANLALDETVELAKAVKIAREMTSESDTLIIVTADHGHSMSMSGQPDRGNPINKVDGSLAADNISYSTLMYNSGPGYKMPNEDGSRYDPSTADYNHPRYQSPTFIPKEWAAHGGEDVAIFASGPWAHLFTGTMEQSNIPHFLGYASCINENHLSACTEENPYFSSHKKP